MSALSGRRELSPYTLDEQLHVRQLYSITRDAVNKHGNIRASYMFGFLLHSSPFLKEASHEPIN